MRKLIIPFVLLLLIVAACAAIMFIPKEDGRYIWNPYDYARITEIDYKAQLLQHPGGRGSVIVTERLTFDVHAFKEENLYWELQRPLPEKYESNLLVSYNVNSVKQILDNGTELIYEKSSRLYETAHDYTGNAYSSNFGPGKWYHDRESISRNRSLFFYVDGLYRDTITFEIEYEIFNASLAYNDSSKLALTIFSGPSTIYIEKINGQIIIPDEIMPAPDNYTVFTYGTNFYSFPYLTSRVLNPGNTTFSFELTSAHLLFKQHNRSLEFVMIAYGSDKHNLSRYWLEHTNTYTDMLGTFLENRDQYEMLPKQYETIKYIVLSVFTFISFMIVIFAIRSNMLIRKRNNFYTSAFQIKSSKEIPDGAYGDEVDAAFAAKLVFCKHNIVRKSKDDFAAVILSLVRKGYIEFAQIRNDKGWDLANVRINVLIQPERSPPEASFYQIHTDLTPVEKQYFNLIVRHHLGFGGLALPISSFLLRVADDHQNTNKFAHKAEIAITQIGIKERYYPSGLFRRLKEQVQSRAIRHAVTGIIAMTLGNLAIFQSRLDLAFGSFFILGGAYIISAIYQGLSSTGYVLLTQHGENEYSKWRALYNYIKAGKLNKNSYDIDLSAWELYYIYATAFGIPNKVIKAIRTNCQNSEDSVILVSDSFYITNEFHRFAKNFSKAVKTASHISFNAFDDIDTYLDSDNDGDDEADEETRIAMMGNKSVQR